MAGGCSVDGATATDGTGSEQVRRGAIAHLRPRRGAGKGNPAPPFGTTASVIRAVFGSGDPEVKRRRAEPGRLFWACGRRFRWQVVGMDGPTFELEALCIGRGFARVAGLDEVGRGPLAGPVTAAAVVLDAGRLPDGLNDSKKLTAEQRDALLPEIMAAAEVSVGHASVEEIDRLNILRAAHLAMVRAFGGLSVPPDHLLIDGTMIPRDITCPASAVVGGDARCLTIAAASIVAKCARDAIMVDLAQQHPGYGWETNMGYGVAAHLEGLKRLGVTPHHRRSFRPVHNILLQVNSASF